MLIPFARADFDEQVRPDQSLESGQVRERAVLIPKVVGIDDLGAKGADRVHHAAMVASVVVAVVAPEVRAGPGRDVVQTGRGVMALHHVVARVNGVVIRAMIGVSRWNAASRRNRCRRSSPPSFLMKRASSPWRGRSR